MNTKKIKMIILFLFPIILYSQEPIEFFQQFVKENYDLKRGYQKGCYLNFKKQNFQQAKNFLKILYITHFPYSFYCNCKIIFNLDKKLIPSPECGYKTKNPRTEYMINWEHIMPAHYFGQYRECWQKKICTKEKNGRLILFKGRKCCSMIDPCFSIMEGDVHNLQPSIYELNFDRKNYPYGEIEGEERKYGSCDFEVDTRKNIVEPRNQIRGDIARTYLYMSWFYGIPLKPEDKKNIIKWNQLDPPSEEEIRLNQLKAKYQGNENPFISYYKYK